MRSTKTVGEKPKLTHINIYIYVTNDNIKQKVVVVGVLSHAA